MDPRGPYLERPGPGHQGTFRRIAVAHHQTAARPVDQLLVAFDVVGDLGLESCHQHSLGALDHQLVQHPG